MTIYNDYRLNQKPTILTGTQANRPVTTTSGTLYKPTDGYYDSVYNGSSWDTYVDGFKCSKPPLATTFSGINFGSYVTLTQDEDQLQFLHLGDNNGSNNCAAAVTAIPASGAYTFIVGMEVVTLNILNQAGFFGICFTDGVASNSKAVSVFGCSLNSSTYGLFIYHQQWTFPGSWNATPTQVSWPPYLYTNRFYMRFVDDRSSTITFTMSRDCKNWDLITPVTMSRTAWLTPSHIGLFTGHSTVSVAVGETRMRARIFHWSLGA